MDFLQTSRLRIAMDHDTEELIALLCTRIAMIMEDASDVAIELGSATASARPEQLRQLERAAGQVRDLVQAVLALED